jgi:hypothetical protein
MHIYPTSPHKDLRESSLYESQPFLTPSRARMFSRFMGILYIGFAVGPMIASFVLRQSVTKVLTPLFFLSAGSYTISLLFILLVVPESLHSSDKPHLPSSSDNTENAHPENGSNLAMLGPLRRLVAPLAAFRPRRAGAMRKDYTLTIIAVSYFIYLMSLALYPLKYLYAEHGGSRFIVFLSTSSRHS